MSRKPKISPDEKICAVEAYLDGKLGYTEACRKYEIDDSVWRSWVRLYKTYGPEGLISHSKNRIYTKEIKTQVVVEYLKKGISLRQLCLKYGITCESIVLRWIKRYNGQKGFSYPYGRSEIYMTKGRKTTLEERIEIVCYCVANNMDYGKAIEKYHVSYHQIYNWVHKYKESGVDRLTDKRGKRKTFEEMTEVEQLQAKLKILEAENKRKDMEIDILKKLQEVERRRG